MSITENGEWREAQMYVLKALDGLNASQKDIYSKLNSIDRKVDSIETTVINKNEIKSIILDQIELEDSKRPGKMMQKLSTALAVILIIIQIIQYVYIFPSYKVEAKKEVEQSLNIEIQDLQSLIMANTKAIKDIQKDSK